MSGRPAGRIALGALILSAVVLGVAISPAVAAGTTDVVISPQSSSLSAGTTTTVDIAVTAANGGVGAWEGTFNLTDGSVADITAVELQGDPGLSTVDIAPDNDSVYFDGALADTDDTGEVVFVTVTIEATAGGTTDLELAIDAIGDEEGSSYTVGSTRGATLSVGDGSGSGNGGGDSDSSTSTGTATGSASGATATATATPASREAATAATTTTVSPTDGSSSTSTTETSATATTSTDGPGFGASIAVISLVTLGFLARRRR